MAKKIFGLVLLLVIGGGVTAYVKALANNKIVFGYNKDYMPDQPIPYSHEIHAGQLKINCKYCHSGVETSRHAQVPSLNVCMNCHLGVKVRDEAQGWINQISEAYNSGQSVAWEKVHLLPDHVKFNHSLHIKAGKDCTECHGPIEQMPVVYQYSSMSMGWCVNCHRKPENNAPITCGTCHY